MKDKNKKYTEGYFIRIGIALGILFGIPLANIIREYGFHWNWTPNRFSNRDST
jgi:hypothetical protein